MHCMHACMCVIVCHFLHVSYIQYQQAMFTSFFQSMLSLWSVLHTCMHAHKFKFDVQSEITQHVQDLV